MSQAEYTITQPEPPEIDEHSPEAPANQRIYRWVEFLSAAMLALATIATAWSGYQSSLWNGEQTRHRGRASTAEIKSMQYRNLAEQRVVLHTNLFGQWATAVSSQDTALAEFLFARFPEPLKSASVAWRATQPLTNPDAPASPFEMPEYVLDENTQATQWEETSSQEYVTANQAGDISDEYLLFTIIFASVLFFGGISGKFRWKELDIAVLVIGAGVLVVGVTILLLSPIRWGA